MIKCNFIKSANIIAICQIWHILIFKQVFIIRHIGKDSRLPFYLDKHTICNTCICNSCRTNTVTMYIGVFICLLFRHAFAFGDVNLDVPDKYGFSHQDNLSQRSEDFKRFLCHQFQLTRGKKNLTF